MKPRQQRMVFVAVVLSGVAIAAVLALTAIQENILYFFSPSQILAGEHPKDRTLRVGGLVVDGSVQRTGHRDLTVQFDITDTAEKITVKYTGILPDLFREGQGIVAIGAIKDDGIFIADTVLAKHDEKYMPPEVADALQAAKEGGQMKMPESHTRTSL